MSKGDVISGFAAFLLSIAVLAAFVLAAGGVWLIVRAADPKRGALMLLAALVTLANVAIWAL
jgi:hypothetical protein